MVLTRCWRIEEYIGLIRSVSCCWKGSERSHKYEANSVIKFALCFIFSEVLTSICRLGPNFIQSRHIRSCSPCHRRCSTVVSLGHRTLLSAVTRWLRVTLRVLCAPYCLTYLYRMMPRLHTHTASKPSCMVLLLLHYFTKSLLGKMQTSCKILLAPESFYLRRMPTAGLCVRLLRDVYFCDRSFWFFPFSYQFHVLVEGGLVYICCSDPDYGRRQPYAYLTEVYPLQCMMLLSRTYSSCNWIPWQL